MNVGSLFAGIGGFDLGLERAGMRTLWQVEQNPLRRAILHERFPHAEQREDVREIRWNNIKSVDVITGGFPCKGVSESGKAEGFDHPETALWREMARVVGELRPDYVIVENVPKLLTRNNGGLFAEVLGDLAALGFDAEWDCLPAAAFGAPHLRDRLWLVAYTTEFAGRPQIFSSEAVRANPLRSAGWSSRSSWWEVEPDVGRVANGISGRMDRLAALGDALVPQIAEWIGSRIIEHAPWKEKAA